jgi:predicted MFS family arabinose efflux permease
LTGAGVLLLSCLTAPLSPDVLPLSVSIFFLGLGWNFCFVGGSTLLADQLSPVERAQTQGANDLLVGLASATGSLGAGIIFSALGYALAAAIGAGLALIPIFFSLNLLWNQKRKDAIPASVVGLGAKIFRWASVR